MKKLYIALKKQQPNTTVISTNIPTTKTERLPFPFHLQILHVLNFFLPFFFIYLSCQVSTWGGQFFGEAFIVRWKTNSISERVPGTQCRSNELQKTTAHVRRFRRCGKSRRTSAGVHLWPPGDANEEEKRLLRGEEGLSTPTICPTRNGHVHVFWITWTHSTMAVSTRSSGDNHYRHPGFIEVSLKILLVGFRLRIDGSRSGGLSAIIIDRWAFSGSRFLSSGNNFYVTGGRGRWLLSLCMLGKRDGFTGWRDLAIFFFFFVTRV